MKRKSTKSITYAAILTAFGILIPMVMPVKMIIGPASYTLASHVPLFLASFISLPVALFVAIGTTLGFFMAGFPIIIVMRALSQILFALIASYMIMKDKRWIEDPVRRFIFGLTVNLVHAIAELLVVYLMTATADNGNQYFWTLFGLVGIGTFIHGLFDYYLALFLWRTLKKKVK